MKHSHWYSIPFVQLLVGVTFFTCLPAYGFDLQGHRGARGLFPENTLPAFKAALGIGVSTLELDVVLSADDIPVIGHDPRLRSHLARDSKGRWVEDKAIAIRDLPYHSLRNYDVGRIRPDSRYATRFPQQRAVDGTFMPKLAALFAFVQKHGIAHVKFNIETKITPAPEVSDDLVRLFVDRIMADVLNHKMENRVTIQSFDWRALQEVQKRYPTIPTVYLTAHQSWLSNTQPGQPGASPWTAGFDIDSVNGDTAQLVHQAGGAVWSPYHRELSLNNIRGAQQRGLKVIPWTVNDVQRMHQLIDWGVDGIITDYPDRLYRVLGEQGITRPPRIKFSE